VPSSGVEDKLKTKDVKKQQENFRGQL